MKEKSRLKFAMLAFFTFVIVAVLKHWLPGISETILGIAAGSPLAYIIGDTVRKSDK